MLCSSTFHVSTNELWLEGTFLSLYLFIAMQKLNAKPDARLREKGMVTDARYMLKNCIEVSKLQEYIYSW